MTNKNTDGDNWGQLLSDFGIKDENKNNPLQDHHTQDAAPQNDSTAGKEPTFENAKSLPESNHSDAFGAGLLDSTENHRSSDRNGTPAESADKPREKKSIFSRFPKINFFGAAPEVSLDSVIEGVRSPSLGGKTFTDNKLEQMPVSQELTDRQRKERQTTRQDEGSAKRSDAPEQGVWSDVASQIGAIASGGDSGKRTEQGEGRPAKRVVSSMFDDPIPESEEVRALKNLIGDQPRRDVESRGPKPRDTAHRDGIPRDAFLEEEGESEFRSRGRGRRKPLHEKRQTEERLPNEHGTRERVDRAHGDTEMRGRGSRYRSTPVVNDLPESDFEMMDDDTSAPRGRGRGRRGARYDGDVYSNKEYAGNDYRKRERVPEELPPQEEWSEVDAALQSSRGGPPPRGASRGPSRGGRHQHSDRPRRSEREEVSAIDQDAMDGAEVSVRAFHGDVPSWDDAIGGIISGNIARHRAQPNSGRGRR
ncbi:MAG: hypothetical protein FWG73_06015 [Planctomycetaceae bacterium]|nr:hypothetical protein [Planctomycetaceae bacterium]